MHETERSTTTERITTGVRGVDLVLGGGFVAGSVQLVVGHPGAGKTIFANQFAFHLAKAGHSAVYVTLLAESHARMLTHLGGFTFFDPEMVSRRILYMSGHSVLDQAGLDGLLELLTRTIRENSASLLIIDGLNTAKEFAETTTSFKRFLLRLATSASLTNCTTLLISLHPEPTRTEPEMGTVDGIVRLEKRLHGSRVVRELSVDKMRATFYALGMHAFDIDEHGLHVYPRIESMRLKNGPKTRSQRRLEFGVEGLDAMLGGGVAEGSTTGLIGPPGTGKTLLGSCFLATGLGYDEKALYVGLRESPEHVMQQGRGIGLYLDEPLARGLLKVLWFPALETSIDALAWELLDQIAHEGIKRVFIDGIDTVGTMFVYPERLPRFCTALITRLGNLGCTTIIAESTQAQVRDSIAVNAADNVLVLREALRLGRVTRLITAQKRQGGQHEISPRRLQISNRGLFVGARRWWLFNEDKP
ncbi:MAG TPA: ATPase domain-containing protein [Polyangium sp.]|nr:ATPase domain-containing protein [Polyangium sp.]